MANTSELELKLKQAEADKAAIQKNIDEIKKKINEEKIPRGVSIGEWSQGEPRVLLVLTDAIRERAADSVVQVLSIDKRGRVKGEWSSIQRCWDSYDNIRPALGE